jgi:hypothetical protein
MPSQTHVRPKVRRKPTKGADGGGSSPQHESSDVSNATTDATGLPAAASLPKSILRKPKYTSSPMDGSNAQEEGQSGTALTGMLSQDRAPEETRTAPRRTTPLPSSTGSTVTTKKPAAMRDMVMERPRQKRNKNAKKVSPKVPFEKSTLAAAVSIEGYTPRDESLPRAVDSQPEKKEEASTKTATVRKDDASETPRTKDEEILILNSLADMLETSGAALPPKDTPISEASVVEANLEFSVMTPEDYDELKEEQREEQYRVFEGQASIFQEDETDKENSVEDPEEENVLDDEDDDVFGGNYFNDGQNEEAVEREPRAFMKLWSALSQWITPQAVAFVKAIRSSSRHELEMLSAVDRSDLGASRCAGLMAVIQLYFRSSLEGLGHDLEERRPTERLLGDLLRCFDYSLPSPRLDTAHSKAMTAILLQTVLWKSDEEDAENPAARPLEVPVSCQTVGLTLDEFRYLTVSAIVNLSTPM